MEAVEKYYEANRKGELPFADRHPLCHLAEINYTTLFSHILEGKDAITKDGGFYNKATKEYVAQLAIATIGWEKESEWLDNPTQQVTFRERVLVKSPNGHTQFGANNALVMVKGMLFLARPTDTRDDSLPDFLIGRPVRANIPTLPQYNETLRRQWVKVLKKCHKEFDEKTPPPWRQRHASIPKDIFTEKHAEEIPQ